MLKYNAERANANMIIPINCIAKFYTSPLQKTNAIDDNDDELIYYLTLTKYIRQSRIGFSNYYFKI